MFRLSKSEFRNILNTLWYMFVKSNSLIVGLEKIGLNVDDDKCTDPTMPHFGCLFGMQTNVDNLILKIFGLQDDNSALEDINEFVGSIIDDHFDYDAFPDDCFEEFLDIIRQHTNNKLPWDASESDIFYNENNFGGAYWDKGEFGDTAPAEMMQSDPNIRLYEATVSVTGGMSVWARSETDAWNLVNALSEENASKFITFDNFSVTDVYGDDI